MVLKRWNYSTPRMNCPRGGLGSSQALTLERSYTPQMTVFEGDSSESKLQKSLPGCSHFLWEKRKRWWGQKLERSGDVLNSCFWRNEKCLATTGRVATLFRWSGDWHPWLTIEWISLNLRSDFVTVNTEYFCNWSILRALLKIESETQICGSKIHKTAPNR